MKLDTLALGDTGIKPPILALGTYGIRNPMKMQEVIKASIDMGVNHIDTAEMYKGSEEIIGEAIKNIRDQVFITSKVLPSNASFKGTLKACERSLKKLKTDYLDLYLLHWWESTYPIEETMRAFKKLIQEGKIRFAGVSNFSIKELKETQECFTPIKIVCNQVEYNLKEGIEKNLRSYCKEKKITLTGYSPLWQGDFKSVGSKRRQVLENIGKRYGKTWTQVVLSYLAKDRDIIIIFKTESLKHLQENIEAVSLQLLKEDIEFVERTFIP